MAKDKEPLTHKWCVNLAATWLSNRATKTTIDSNLRCRIVLREPTNYLSMYGDEQPDVLGIWGANSTVNIEVKVSRSDFFADSKKLHNHPYGHYKIYACPNGLIKPEEVPNMWGLLYLTKAGGKLVVEPKYHKNEVQEVTGIMANIMLNAITAGAITSEHLRRKGQWDGKGVIL